MRYQPPDTNRRYSRDGNLVEVHVAINLTTLDMIERLEACKHTQESIELEVEPCNPMDCQDCRHFTPTEGEE